jgi:hypothetical protein
MEKNPTPGHPKERFPMDTSLLADLAEVAGSIAVLASLVFIGFQIRQYTNAIRGATELAAAHELAHWYSRRSAEDRRLFARAARDDLLDEADAATYIWMQAEYFHLCEGWFRQYRRGLMSTATWEPLAAAAVGILEGAYMRQWWDDHASPIAADFRAYLDERLKSPDRTWTLRSTEDTAARALERIRRRSSGASR